MQATTAAPFPAFPLPPTQSPPNLLAPLPSEAAHLLDQAVEHIFHKVIKTLSETKHLSLAEFLHLHCAQKQEIFLTLAPRTKEFSLLVLHIVNPKLDAIPSLPQSFDQLASHTQDPLIRTKLITLIALPQINQLIDALDAAHPLLIDTLVPKPTPLVPLRKPRTPSLTLSLQAITNRHLPSLKAVNWQKTSTLLAGMGICVAFIFWHKDLLTPRAPYDLGHAQKIHHALTNILSENFNPPLFPSNRSTPLSFEIGTLLPYSLEVNYQIFPGRSVWQAGGSEFLEKISKLIGNHCLFQVIVHTYDTAAQRILKLVLESSCLIPR